MTGSCNGDPEVHDEKRLNDDLLLFMRKRSETDAPRYTARLKTYIDLQHKRRRAAVARHHAEHGYKAAHKTPSDSDSRGKGPSFGERPGLEEDRTSRSGKRWSRSRSLSREESDACCRRRRRRRCARRKRRRSCRRRRRRRCSRRRRRRKCARRRRRRRRRC